MDALLRVCRRVGRARPFLLVLALEPLLPPRTLPPPPAVVSISTNRRVVQPPFVFRRGAQRVVVEERNALPAQLATVSDVASWLLWNDPLSTLIRSSTPVAPEGARQESEGIRSGV